MSIKFSGSIHYSIIDYFQTMRLISISAFLFSVQMFGAKFYFDPQCICM